MYVTVLRLLWPYLGRYLAERAATYLQARRERRLEKFDTVPEKDSDVQSCEVVSEAGEIGANSSVWFVLSGVLLGSALTYGLTRLVEEDQRS